MSIQKSTIVILIPCLNEEITIRKVIRDFQKSIPEAQIVVFDNNSSDRTASIALETGAKVIKELRPGKGHCLLYTSPSPRDGLLSRMPSSA